MPRSNETLRALQHLARHPRRLFKLELRAYQGATADEAGCLISNRATRARHARYPSIKFTYKSRFRLTLYIHTIVVLATRIRTRQASGMWDPIHLNVSHNCHNTRCINPAHLALVSPANNNARTHHCVARVACPSCPAAFNLCHHIPPCITSRTCPCCACSSHA